ncbi:sensor histidine kinase [Ramlibacter henchirensis]|uniref:sensor histidine kinase n=1 Tax=Ramlibacter henchirensis TaxID=204072 RepID=UPI001980E9C2|nr:PAS domain-containing protein [Ramlibacter henchirensis]
MPLDQTRRSHVDDTNLLVRRAADMGRLGAWSWDFGAGRIHCSRESSAILGLRPGRDPTPAQARACFAPEHRRNLLGAFLDCARAGTPFDVEAQVRHPAGARTWVRIIGEPEWNGMGTVVRMQGALQDITPAKRAQEQLLESRRELASLMDNLPGMAYRCSNAPRWPLQFASDRALELTGYRAADLVAGRPAFGDLVHPGDAQRVWDQVQQSVRQHQRFNVTYRIRCRDGREKWVWEQGCGVFDADGTLRFVEGLILDVTFAKRIEAELNALNQTLEDRVRERTAQLESANAELEAFAYSIAHDLRAPMTAMAGFARVLQESLPALEGRSAHYLRRIIGNVAQMSDMTDALLSLARLTGVDVEPAEVDIGELAANALAPLQEQEPQRAIVAAIQPRLRVRGDRRLLQQLLANLVGNAWKFSRTRDVVNIEVGSSGVQDGYRAFFVRDRGVGFDMAHAANLFGAFRRLHGAGEFEGTGIGLALVRKIVQRHGGRVWADAQPGAGATIHFTLPEAAGPPLGRLDVDLQAS